jgi:peptide/nickel transport system permease protein
LIGVATIVIGAVPGVILGLVAGYFGRFWDAGIMRLTDAMLAFPYFLSAIVVVALLGLSLENTIIAVGTYLIPSYVRLVRGSVLLIKRREYVEAARMIGSTDLRIIGWHILPNTLSALIVHSTLSFPRSVIAASSLSFLGLGIQPPAPEWGAMVADSRNYLVLAPQAVFFPTLAIVVLSIAFNFMGEGLRDFLDPRMRRL